jgi:hypothetical protein
LRFLAKKQNGNSWNRIDCDGGANVTVKFDCNYKQKWLQGIDLETKKTSNLSQLP